MNKTKLTPFIKWPGGKSKELREIRKDLPPKVNRYFEPFLGGGSVFFNLGFKQNYINDFSVELMDLYRLIASRNKEFYDTLDEIVRTWHLLEEIVYSNRFFLENMYTDFRKDYHKFEKSKLKSMYKDKIYIFVIQNAVQFNGLLSDYFNNDIDHFLRQINKSLYDKINRMNKIEINRGNLPKEDIITNIETAFKSAYYIHFRYVYNNRKSYMLSEPYSSAFYYFIREYCYSSMFRYNKQGHFNVPYGGISYNRKNFQKKVDYIKSKELSNFIKNAKLYTLDFEKFFIEVKLQKDDFIFLDPPYDTDFSTYANNEFDKKDQIRLANLLMKTKAYFMLIIKNTDFIYELYNKEGIFIKAFDKKYMVSFKNRNERDVKHLLITNYNTKGEI